MKNTIKKLFKPVAVIKYLFFPFIMAQSQGTVDFSKIIRNEKISVQTENQFHQIEKAKPNFVLLHHHN